MIPPPLSRIYDLSSLSDAGDEVVILSTPEQRARLAEWAGVDAVESFEARVALHRRSAGRFDYQAAVTADVVQSCVVSLQPVRSHLTFEVSRELHLSKLPPSAKVSPYEFAAVEDGPEELQDSRYDLAGPVLEDFVLSIDPYPRAPGVSFEPPQEQDIPESPFAVLKPLRNGD